MSSLISCFGVAILIWIALAVIRGLFKRSRSGGNNWGNHNYGNQGWNNQNNCVMVIDMVVMLIVIPPTSEQPP